MVEACNEGDFSKVRKLLDEGRVSVHDTTEEGESLLSLACSAGYYELAQVNFHSISRKFFGKKNKIIFSCCTGGGARKLKKKVESKKPVEIK